MLAILICTWFIVAVAILYQGAMHISLLLHNFSSYTMQCMSRIASVQTAIWKKILRIINLLLYKWIAILIDLLHFKISLIQSISNSQQLYRPLFVKCLNELKIFPLTSQLQLWQCWQLYVTVLLYVYRKQVFWQNQVINCLELAV